MPRTTSAYMSGPHDSENCGCRFNDREWTNRCAAAMANDRAVSARWAADHVRASPDTEFTTEYLALAIEGGLQSTCEPRNEDLR